MALVGCRYVRYIVQRRRVSRLCERCRKSFDESCEPPGAVNDTFATKGRSLDHAAPNSLGEADARLGGRVYRPEPARTTVRHVFEGMTRLDCELSSAPVIG